jgi:hypothetical protein
MNWFKIETIRGDKEHQYVGSSEETLDSFAQKVQSGHFVRLDQLQYYDRGEIKDWTEWDKSLVPSVLINPRTVISVMQFRGDPRVTPNP